MRELSHSRLPRALVLLAAPALLLAAPVTPAWGADVFYGPPPGPVYEQRSYESYEVRRFSHPAEVRASIFERIRSERRKKVTDYQSDGERQARNIESSAEEKVRTMLADARFEEERLKSEADMEALQIRNQAQSKDPVVQRLLAPVPRRAVRRSPWRKC